MLEAALVLVVPTGFPVGMSVQAGTLTALGDLSDTFDWEIYAERDRQLAYRDDVLATHVVTMAVEIGEIWGMKVRRPVLASPVDDDLESAGYPGPIISNYGSLNHVTTMSTPGDAAVVDDELYARDILIHETLAQAGTILVDNPASLEPLDTYPGTIIFGGTISPAWSLGEGTILPDSINPVLPLNKDLFKRPDMNLAERDNILAHYASSIEQVLKNPFENATRLSVSVDNVGTREAETYTLVEETATRKVFQAEPHLDGRLQIVYSKQLQALQWSSEVELAFHPPKAQPFLLRGVTVPGILPGQKLTFVPSTPGARDSQYWRQKATWLQFAFYDETTVYHTSDPASILTYGNASYNAAVIAVPRYIQLTVPGTYDAGTYRCSLLFTPKPELVIPGGANTISQGDSGYDGGVDYSAAGDTIQWKFTLPAGSWTLRVHYTNRSGTAPSQFLTAVVVSGMSSRNIGFRFAVDNLENEDNATVDIPVTATGAQQSLIISWNPGSGNDSVLHLTKLQFLSSLSTTIEPEFTLKSFNGALQMGPTARMSIIGRRYRSDVLEFNQTWTSVTNPVIEIERSDSGDYVSHFYKLQIQRLDSNVPLANAQGVQPVRAQFLKRALASIRDAYLNAVQSQSGRIGTQLDDGTYRWTTSSTEAWMNVIESKEARVRQAFRVSRPGDIGRPALFPTGLELITENTGEFLAGEVKSNNANSGALPILVQLQPWMVEIGIYVSHEDFWDNELISTDV